MAKFIGILFVIGIIMAIISWAIENIVGVIGLLIAVWGGYEWNKNHKLGVKSKLPGVIMASGIFLALGWIAFQEILNTLAFAGLLFSFITLCLTLFSAVKRNPEWKKWLAATGTSFVVFMVCIINAPAIERSKTTNIVKESSEEATNQVAQPAISTTSSETSLSNKPTSSNVQNQIKTEPKPQPQTSTVNQEIDKRHQAKITRVIDGDTMDVSVNGKNDTIRLLLVDTPETKDPNEPVQPFGPEASAFAKETLEGKDVKLEIDVSERDKYGRLLTYLWIGDKMFNEMLLEKGLARVAYVIPPNVKYVDQYREVQKTAQSAGTGIWSIENYAQEDGFHEEVAVQKEAPKPQPKPAPQPVQKKVETPPPVPSADVFYANCTEARAAGAAPLYEGEPGYRSKLDRDKDGVACE